MKYELSIYSVLFNKKKRRIRNVGRKSCFTVVNEFILSTVDLDKDFVLNFMQRCAQP